VHGGQTIAAMALRFGSTQKYAAGRNSVKGNERATDRTKLDGGGISAIVVASSRSCLPWRGMSGDRQLGAGRIATADVAGIELGAAVDQGGGFRRSRGSRADRP